MLERSIQCNDSIKVVVLLVARIYLKRMRHTLNSNKLAASKAQTHRIDRAAVLDCIAEVVPKRGVIVQHTDHRHNRAQCELQNSERIPQTRCHHNNFREVDCTELLIPSHGRTVQQKDSRSTISRCRPQPVRAALIENSR